MLTQDQKYSLLNKANEAFLDAGVRWYWRKIEYSDTAPVWIAYRIPDLQPWEKSGDMVPETFEVFRFTGEHAARRFVRMKMLEAALDAILGMTISGSPLPNQSVKAQGDNPQESRDSPGERG